MQRLEAKVSRFATGAALPQCWLLGMDATRDHVAYLLSVVMGRGGELAHTHSPFCDTHSALNLRGHMMPACGYTY